MTKHEAHNDDTKAEREKKGKKWKLKGKLPKKKEKVSPK